MAKAKIFIKLKSPYDCKEQTFSGIIKDNRIVYIDGDLKTSINIGTPLILKRENDEYLLEINFSIIESTGKYLLKKYNRCMDLNIKTEKLNIRPNKIDIKYQMNTDVNETDNFYLEIKYKKI